MTRGYERVACNVCGDSKGPSIAHEVRAIQTEAGEFVFDVTLVCCSRCGLVYWTPRMNAPALQRYYQAAYRAPVGASTLDDARRNTIQARLALLGNGSRRRLLEIGCGEGFFLQAASEAGFAATGVEPSGAYRELARAIAPQAQIFGGMFEEFVSAEPFDIVCSFFVLEHTLDAAAFLRRCRSMLKPDGTLFLEVPDVDRYESQTGDMLWHEHTYHFTPKVMRRLLARSGFAVDAIVSPGPSYGFGMAVLATPSQTVAERWREGLPDTVATLEAIAAFAAHRAVVTRYRRALHDVLEPILVRARAGNCRVALYGCGVFQEQLFEHAGLRASDVVAVVDDNQRRWGTETSRGLRVDQPLTLVTCQPDVVIVASDAFEASIAARIAALPMHSSDVRIVRPHSDALATATLPVRAT